MFVNVFGRSQHATIYVVGGVLLFGLAVYLLLGGQVHLPMPGRRVGNNVDVASVYTLGVFSGITSSCCAPVLAGVIALSSVAPSFGIALGLGTAYVFGMVAPLFMISLLWERFDWGASHLFHPRSFTWKLGRLQRTISATNLQQVGRAMTGAFAWLPNWAAALILLLLLALLAWRALWQVGSHTASEESQVGDGEQVEDESRKEKIGEY